MIEKKKNYEQPLESRRRGKVKQEAKRKKERRYRPRKVERGGLVEKRHRGNF